MGDVTVGIDIGTTATKAVAADGDGTVVAAARARHGVVVGPGRLEHDAALAWHREVTDAFHEVAAGNTVHGVAVAAMVPSLTAVDAAGCPCGPGLLYGDARGDGTPGESPASSGEAVGFLRWLAVHAPDAGGFWPAQAVANHALCGRAAVDYATAFCAAPLFDGTGWDVDVVRAAGVRTDQLPEVVTDLGPIGRVGQDGPVVGAGTIDALAAQLVAGAEEPGDVLVVLGATLIAWLVVPDWVERPGLWTVPHTAPGLCLVGGASNAGGLFVDWARSVVADAEPVAEPGAGRGRLDPHDVPCWLPYVRGERTPLHRADLRAELSGLHLGHGPSAVHRATYEAPGFVVRRFLDLAGGSSPARRIRAVGGGTRSTAWMEALADVTGLPVEVAAEPDATALGTAFLARCAAGLEADPTDARRWARTGATVDPDPAWAAACDERYQQFVVRTAAATAQRNVVAERLLGLPRDANF
ncbi:MAG: xylulokinase [Acidimicrobiales bacterium]